MIRRTRIPLTVPVTVGGVTYAELQARPAKRKDAGKIAAAAIAAGKVIVGVQPPGAPSPDHPEFRDFALGIATAARLCGVAPEVICRLDPADVERVGAEVAQLADQVF